jgi:hypothetical protein
LRERVDDAQVVHHSQAWPLRARQKLLPPLACTSCVVFLRACMLLRARMLFARSSNKKRAPIPCARNCSSSMSPKPACVRNCIKWTTSATSCFQRLVLQAAPLAAPARPRALHLEQEAAGHTCSERQTCMHACTIASSGPPAAQHHASSALSCRQCCWRRRHIQENSTWSRRQQAIRALASILKA